MKMKFKLISIFACLSLLFGMMSCSNIIEDLKDKYIQVTSITIDDTVTIFTGETTTLTATVLPENATNKSITWTSSDETIATVDNGEVTGIKDGKAIITAKADNKTASCEVTVKTKIIEVESITLDSSASILVGGTKTLSVTVLPENATDKTITWTTSDETIATVSDDGLITGVKEGTVIITAISNNQKTATCNLTVTTEKIEVTSITIDETATITVGETKTLIATVLPENATDKTVTWTSADETIATVSGGVVTGVKTGSVTITASADGKSDSCSVTVKEVPKYNIDWCTNDVTDGKTLYELATKSKKIIFGKPTDYASVITNTATYTKYAVGETDDDLIYAYYKPNDASFDEADPSTCKAELYILSDGKIKFTDNDLITDEVQTKVLGGSFGIPVGLFFYCFYAEEIKLCNIYTTELTDMTFMFTFDQSLTELDLTDLDTSNVTSMYGLFTDCQKLKNLDLSNFNTSKVTNMSVMFGGSDVTGACVKLESINFGNIDTSNVTNMSNMFYGCKSLTNIDLSKFNTSNVTNMGLMFCNCFSLTSIDVSKFNTSNVTIMGSMFYGCKISELDISAFDFTSVTETVAMFGKCINLKTIYVKEGTDLSTMSSITSSNNMFKDCTSLVGGKGTTFDSNKIDKTYARIDGGSSARGYFTKKGDVPYKVFRIDWKTTKVAPEGLNKTPYELATTASKIVFGKPANYASVISDTANYTKNAVGETDDDLIYAYYKTPTDDETNDGELYVFSEGEIKFEEDDMIVSGSESYGPFYDCEKVKNIVLKNINTSSLTNLSHCFNQCSELETIDLSGLDTENVTDMSSLFDGCVALKYLDLSNFNTSKVTTMEFMFEWCNSLESLNMTGFDTSNVTNMGSMFEGCFALKSLDVTSFDTSNVTNMNVMFYYCQSLETLDLSDFDTSNITDMYGMFYGCNSLKSLNLSGFDTKNVTKMNSMFYYCQALETLDLTGFDTSNVTDMNCMFYRCDELTAVDLSTFTFEKIKNTSYMFYETKKLKTIYVKDGTDLSTSASITSSSNMFKDCISLKGGKGTVFDSSKTDKTYARVNTSDDDGYFTFVQIGDFDKSNFLNSRFYKVKDVRWDSMQQSGSRVWLPKNCYYDNGEDRWQLWEISPDEWWTPYSYITLELNETTDKAGELLGNSDTEKEVSTFKVTLYTSEGDAAGEHLLFESVYVVGICEEGMMIQETENHYYSSFIYTNKGWNDAEEEGEGNLYQISVDYDYAYPTLDEINEAIANYE